MNIVSLFDRKDSNGMKILDVSIRGFRNVKDVVLNLDDITSLISLNSYGKSNLLHGIDFGVVFINASPRLKSNMMNNQDCIPITKDNQGQNYYFDITCSTFIDEKEYIINYSFSFNWRSKLNSAKIVSESLRFKINEKGQKYSQIILRDKDKSYFKSSEKGRCSSVIKIESNELIVNKLLAFDDFFYIDIIKSINNLEVYIDRHLDASSLYQINPFIKKNQEPLSIAQEESIPRLVYALRDAYPDKFDLLINSYKLLFPNFINIVVSDIDITNKITIDGDNNFDLEDAPFVLDNKIYKLFVFDNRLNQPLDFEYLSDGAKRLFLLLAYAIISDIKGISILVIEEPENSVHPSLLQAYLQLLNDITENCRIIITSHSPYLVQYLKPTNIYVGIPNCNGIAIFNRISQKGERKLINDAYEFSDSTGNYLFDLLSGSEENLDILNTYLEVSND